MDAVEEIKSRLNIEDVVSEYVQLKRSGRNFKGLSPFTAEKTPSFMVSPEKQIWHDFSSGKGGNMFSFIMEMEGLEFKEALELLARKANVDLEQFRTTTGRARGLDKERLYAANEAACKFYQVQFSHSQTALEYVFSKRQFTKETALDFRLGYSPNNGSALIGYLKKQGFTEKEITQAGLTSRRYRGGVQDMFRGRLMVPLADQQGRIIGFTARLLEDIQDAPKYINTPQTPLYDKSRHVYGLHLAKESLRKDAFAVLVEGNLDVIASHQAEVRNVVATAGTALTEMHLKTISRFTGDIRLAFDQDKAGIAATERAIPIASKVGVRLSIVTIPAGKDPDELVKKDPALWRDVITKPDYAIDWVIHRYRDQLDLEKAPEKREFSDVTLALVRQLPDKVEQDHYVQKIASILSVNPEAITSKLRETPSQRARKTIRRDVRQDVKVNALELERKKLQDQLLSICMMRPGLRHHLDMVQIQYLPEENAQLLLEYLQENPDFDGRLTASPQLKKIAEYIKIVSLQYETLYQDQDDADLGQEAKRLRTRLIEQYVKTKKAEIAYALEDADDSTSEKLLAEARDLDALLKQLTT
jgi:DNA primase